MTGTVKVPGDVAGMLAALGVKAQEGWDAMDPASPANAEQKERSARERYQRAKIIADGVSDEALNMMREQTTDASTWQVGELGLLNAIGFGIMREGQNSLVRWIEQQRRIAAQGPTGEGVGQRKQRGRGTRG
jgi:hypothetical protein